MRRGLFVVFQIDKKIKDLTYNELKKIKLLNTNQTIPTLNEVLDIVNGKVLIDGTDIKELSKEIKDCKAEMRKTTVLTKKLEIQINDMKKMIEGK